MRLISSIKALITGRDTFLEVTKLEASDRRVYSRMMLMPARNKMMERVHPAKMPRMCLCQLLGEDKLKDLL